MRSSKAASVKGRGADRLQLVWYQRLSFRVGAMSGVLATVALAVATLIAGFQAEQALIEAEEGKIAAVGGLIGSASAAYVAMEEDEAALRALQEIAPAVPGLVRVQIFLPSGEEFVRYEIESGGGGDELLSADATIVGGLGKVRTTVSTASLQAAADRSWRSLLAVLFAGGGVVLLAAALLGDRVARLLREMAEIAQGVANGDLSRTVPTSSQRSEVTILADSFNAMIGNLRVLVDALSGTVAEVGSVAGESLATTHRQQQGAQEQTQAADKTRNETHGLVLSGEQIHEASLAVVANAETSLENNRVTSARIGQLEGLSQKMADLLSLVRDIAEKSEMLALNASLEGVRAQEHGAGFALVASEMQRLSESILSAVRKMQELTVEMREHAFATTTMTSEGIRLAEDTTGSARQIGELVGGFRVGMERVDGEMVHVSDAAFAVASGSSEIAEAMNSLVQLASRLRSQIEVFKLTGPEGN